MAIPNFIRDYVYFITVHAFVMIPILACIYGWLIFRFVLLGLVQTKLLEELRFSGFVPFTRLLTLKGSILAELSSDGATPAAERKEWFVLLFVLGILGIGFLPVIPISLPLLVAQSILMSFTLSRPVSTAKRSKIEKYLIPELSFFSVVRSL